MRAALVTLIIPVLAASSARAEESAPPTVSSSVHGRTWLTGAGLAALGAGVAAAALGVQFELQAADAQRSLTAYLPTGDAVPTAEEESAVQRLKSRSGQSAALGASLLVAAGVLIAAGLAGVVLDRPGPVQVSFAPTRDGAVLVLSGGW